MTNTVLVIVAIVLLLPGIAMAVLPIPGLLYMFVIALIYGLMDHFLHLSGPEVGILATIAGITLLVDFFSGIIGAKWGGAHWSSIVWGLVGLIIGSAVIPIPIVGSVAGMFLGVLTSEFYRTRDARQAQKAATGSFFGWLFGTGFKVVAALVFLGLFIWFVLN